MVKIEGELCAHGVGALMSRDTELPVKPDEIPKGAAYFQYTMAYRDHAGGLMVDARGFALPLKSAAVMEEHDLVLDADGNVIANPDGAGGAVPAGEFYYGPTQSDRSCSYRDYTTERNLADKLYREHVARTTCAVAVIDGCCTETGRLVYEDYTADDQGNPARIPDILEAIQQVIDTGLSMGSSATLDSYRAIAMTYNMNIADLLAIMRKLERIMDGQGDPVSTSVRFEVFKKAIKGWECPTLRPYSKEFDLQDRKPIEFEERVTLLKALEAKMAREHGHGSGSKIPRHSSRGGLAHSGRPSTPRAARIGPFTSVPGESPGAALSSAMAAAAFLCSGCQASDHSIRQCPLYQWCAKCNWCHEKRTGCDNGYARQIWESKRAMSRNRGSQGARGSAQGPSAGGSGSYRAPISGGGVRHSPQAGRGAPRR